MLVKNKTTTSLAMDQRQTVAVETQLNPHHRSQGGCWPHLEQIDLQLWRLLA